MTQHSPSLLTDVLYCTNYHGTFTVTLHALITPHTKYCRTPIHDESALLVDGMHNVHNN